MEGHGIFARFYQQRDIPFQKHHITAYGNHAGQARYIGAENQPGKRFYKYSNQASGGGDLGESWKDGTTEWAVVTFLSGTSEAQQAGLVNILSLSFRLSGSLSRWFKMPITCGRQPPIARRPNSAEVKKRTLFKTGDRAWKAVRGC
jgi:hypothetical protein